MYFSTGIQLSNALAALPPEKVGSFIAFDPAFYAQTYMGAYQGTLSPLEHFVQIGADRFYSPNAKFDPVYYANAYADLRGAGLNSADLLFHFMQFGLDEGRAPNATLATFDGAAYLVANPDVAAYVNANLAQFNGSVTNGAIAHYVKFGAVEGRVAPELAITADQTFKLTTGLDDLAGAAGNDTFTANVVQNVNGEQTNQLATGDKINGGDSTDSLTAVVQMASALNNTAAQAITPITVDVEQANFTALTVTQGAFRTAETVSINAKSMLGLDLVSSTQSDASLTIYNLTTLTDTGLYADKRNTEKVVVRMDHSGNDQALDAASNLTVLFDNDYLVSGAAAVDTAVYYLLDREGAALDATQPLNHINVDGIRFTINGVEKSIFIEPALMTAFLAGAGTFQAFADLLSGALIKAQTVGSSTYDATLVNLAISLDPTDTRTLGLDGTVLPVAAQAIVLTSKLGEPVTTTGFHAYAEATGRYDVFGDFKDNTGTSTIDPIIATIQLEKVGRGAEGGNLTVGGMSTDGNNVWNFSTSAQKEGVQQFNVTVSGDNTQFSDLASLQSTNNTLTTVNVGWATGSVADLTIGNHNTVGSALKDVRAFTAANNNSVAGPNGTTITNDVTLSANVTDESVAKYMDRTDNGVNPVNDNANFVYTFGAGNDALNLNISKANLAASGTTNREDFSMVINSGTGNDRVSTTIGDGTGVATDAWFINSELNNNLAINAGAGNDTVRTNGAGSWNVDLGTGNDAAYSDNSGALRVATTVATFTDTDASGTLTAGDVVLTTGAASAVSFNSGRATWVLNTRFQETNAASPVADLDITNLVSGNNNGATVASAVSYYKSTLTVNLGGVTATVIVDDYASSDLELNNLIKAAIQGNEHLRDLIVAEDGPANTLVVRSLVDGSFVNGDLTVSIAANTIAAMGADQIAAYNAANGTAFTTAAAVSTDVAADVAAFVARTDYDAVLGRQTGYVVGQEAFTGYSSITGADSTAVTASTFVDGTGNDTIVLSTSGLARETVNLTVDAQKDVVFNATFATINGLGAEDQVVLSTGGVLGSTTSWNYLGGSVDNNTITGDAGVNYIFGFAGVDTLSGAGGDDVINGGDGADVINGGSGADNLTGGAAVDTFKFILGENGAPTAAANVDVITDYRLGGDSLIDFTAALTVGTQTNAAAAGVATVTATGFLTFNGADTTLAQHLVAAEAALSGGAANRAVIWQEAGDAYIFVTDAVAGVGAGDSLIKLVGVTAAAGGFTFTAGDISAIA